MEIAAGLIRLNANSGGLVEDWRKTIEARRAEALQTLRDEGVSVESWFQLEIDGAPYLLWYMRAESIQRVWETAGRSTHELDAYHFETMSEITHSQIDAVPLLDLSMDASDT